LGQALANVLSARAAGLDDGDPGPDVRLFLRQLWQVLSAAESDSVSREVLVPVTAADDIAAWVRASRIAQGLSEKITDPEIIAQAVALLSSQSRPSTYRIATVSTLPRSAPETPARGLPQAG
jgi:hypothetical protein